MIHTLRRVFLDGFGKRVHQAPACRFLELDMRRMLELAVNRKDVGRVDNAKLGSTHDAAPGFVVILQVIVLQVLAYGLGRQEVVFQRGYGPVDEFSQDDAAGVAALDDRRTAKRHVRTNADDDPGRQPDREALVVRIADADAAMPFRRR